jgi:hypothetical protein
MQTLVSLTDTSRSLEAGRIVDRRLEAERGDRADTKQGHEPSDLRIITCQLQNLAIEQALGKLCFQLGDRATWNPESPILKTLSRLDPRMVEYSAARAYTQAEDQKYEYQEWNMEWVNAMMNG